MTKPQALAVVRVVLKKKAAVCGYRTVTISARQLGESWRVDAVLAGRVRGVTRWTVLSGKAKAANRLAQSVLAGCPPKRPPPAPVPPAPAPLPPPPPPAPVQATLSLGPGVSPRHVTLVERGLALANGYFRARLGSELPPITVYIHSGWESIAVAFAAAVGVSIENARQFWRPPMTATAELRRFFINVGSTDWFGRPEPPQLKIVGHEAFHLLQSELLAGYPGAPTSGPAWLVEGTAEYIGYRVVAENRLASLDEIRKERWIPDTRATSVPLRALETYAVSPGNSPYSVSALAAERLLSANLGEQAFAAFYAAIGRGASWRDAFSAAFGRSVDAFYDEFEAYRRGL